MQYFAPSWVISIVRDGDKTAGWRRLQKSLQVHDTVLMDDCQHMAAAQLDHRAFAPLFHRYHARVFAFVAARLGDQTEAEDVTSETFRRALTGLASFHCHHEGSFAAWLFRIAHNEVLRQYQRNPANRMIALDDLPDLSADTPDIESDLQRRQQFAQIRGFISHLSPRRQEIITLRFYGEMRNNEIAAVLGLDERTVASHLCRAIDELQTMLQQSMQDETR